MVMTMGFDNLKFLGNFCVPSLVTENKVFSRTNILGQVYQGFLRKRTGRSFGQKRAFASYNEKLEKLTEFHSF
jgi:hypothetical protein